MLNNPTEQQDKEKLISRCKAGDRQALSLLYTHYRPYLLNICKHYAKENSVAEDLLHDAFVVILTSLDKLRSTDKLEVWMATIVRNVGYHYWKHLDKENTAIKQMAAENQDTAREISMPDIALMQTLVSQLPKGYQQVFRLSVFEGLSHQEISRMLNIAPHTSSSQLLHAKRMLQKLIRQSWVVILLLIAIPTAIWRFILKEKPGIEGNPTNPTQKAQIANNRQQKAQQEPTVEHTANHPVYISISTTTASQKPLQYQENYPILPDTIPHNNTEVQNDTKTLASQSPKKESVQDTVTHRPVLQSDLTENGNTDMQIKTKTSAWNIQLAYNGQFGKTDNFMQTASINAKSFSAVSNILIPEETAYSNWNDYSFYLNNALPQQDMTAETRSLMDIAANNAHINGGRMEAHYEHHLPVSLQLTVSRQLNKHLSVETGLSYTTLKSTSTTGSPEAHILEQQRLHYLGIPLRMSRQLYGKAPLSLYTSAGIMMEVPVHSTLSVNHINNGMRTYNMENKLSMPLQWSTSVGLGFQYDLTPHIGFYVEPSLQYFFNDGSDIKSYRTEHPLNFTLPIGIRFH